MRRTIGRQLPCPSCDRRAKSAGQAYGGTIQEFSIEEIDEERFPFSFPQYKTLRPPEHPPVYRTAA